MQKGRFIIVGLFLMLSYAVMYQPLLDAHGYSILEYLHTKHETSTMQAIEVMFMNRLDNSNV